MAYASGFEMGLYPLWVMAGQGGKASNHAVLAYVRPQQMLMGDQKQTPNLIHPRERNSSVRSEVILKTLKCPFILLLLHVPNA